MKIAVFFAVTLAAYAQTIVIQNATILPVTKPSFKGSVVIENGKIREVAEKVIVPPGAQVIEANGQFLMPGIIDCHSHIAADAINEGSVSVSSMVGIEDVVNPTDISIYRALAGGVTTSNILHGSANAIGGKCQLIKMRWGKDASTMTFEGAKPSIKFALGENPKRRGTPSSSPFGSSVPRYPATRMGVEDVIRQAFNDAKIYRANWKSYNEKAARGESAIPPRRDLKLEPLVEVLEGKRQVHAHCYRADEILMLLRVADDYGFKIRTLQHALEGYKVAKEIAAHGAGASTFSDWWAYKIEAYDAIPYNAVAMMKKGVLVSLNSDSADVTRRLNTEAAKTVKYGGATENEALAMITINPAKQLEVDNRVGSIEVGKDADLALFDKHPLSSAAVAQKVWVDGQLYFDRQKDLEERVSKDTRKKQLIEKARQQEMQQKKKRQSGAEARMKLFAFLAAAALFAGADDTFLLRNVTVHPVSGPEIANGTIFVKDGKIAAVGAKHAAEKGVKVVDGKGSHAWPGMINGATELGLQEISSVRETVDTGELGTFNPQLRALIAVNPESEFIPVTRANGITMAMTMPALPSGGGMRSAGAPTLIPGQVALIHLNGWTWEEMEVRRSAALEIVFPTIETRTFRMFEIGEAGRTAFTEAKKFFDKQVKDLGDYFEKARVYQKAKATGSRDFRTDLALEAMIPVLDGKTPVIVFAREERTIKAALEFTDKQKLKVILANVRRPGKQLEEIKKRNIPVILGDTTDLPEEEDDAYDKNYSLAGDFHKAGIKFCFGTFDNQFARNLPFQAGIAMGYGLPADAAVRAVTLSAAEIWGVGDEYGSLDKGKWADIILTDGDLLEHKTQVKAMWIKGRPASLENKHTELFQKYMGRPDGPSK